MERRIDCVCQDLNLKEKWELFQMKCSTVYLTVLLNDILQSSLARYDAKCFAHNMQLLFVLAYLLHLQSH
jgi:hypothetical protein